MSDQDNKPSAGLEGLLRRWGAETAMREAKVPAAPAFDKAPFQAPDEKAGPSKVSAEGAGADQSQSGGPQASAETLEEIGVTPARAPAEAAQPKPGPIRTHWLSAVAGVAAALLLGSLVLFFLSLARSGSGGQVGQELKTVTAERNQARKDLQEAIEAAEAKLADQKDRYDRLVTKTTRDQDPLRQALHEKETEVAKLNTDVAKGTELLAKMAPRLAVATEELKDTRKLLAKKTKQAANLVREVDGKRKRMAVAQEELYKLIKINEQAAATRREVWNKMVLMDARHRALFVDARRIYLSVKAPNAAGLHASQLAARSSDMVARCARLRALADADALRTLVDKLEVFLTRLDLINADSYDEAAAFADLVSTSEILDQIEKALGTRIDDEYFRMWLFEARLILMGTQSAG